MTLSSGLIAAVALIYMAVLFAIAFYGDRRRAPLSPRVRAWVYSLSLAVYCTSWTFYGTVTQAQRSGWPIPPTFLGTILLYVFGFAFLRKLLRLAREHNSTSLADLVATRLGRNSWLAAVVTFVALLGIVPYIALQLKAVAMSYGLLTRASVLAPPPWQDSALYVALAMALFAMLFGTRRASATEHNRGLVLAMAVESLLKLGAMLALGGFVWFGLDLPDVPPVPPPADGASGFPALVLLGALAMFTLPHQFHVGVVECRDEAQRLKFWSGRKNAFPAAGRIAADYYCMDGTIPRRHIATLLRRIKGMEEKYRLGCLNVFHAGDGNMHPLILFNGADPDEWHRAEEFGTEILETCIELGGTITGEHGVGIEKINSMCVQFSDQERELFWGVKAAFDPDRLLNPDKAIPTLNRCAEYGKMRISGGVLPHPELERF